VEQKDYAEAERIYERALEILEAPIGTMTESAGFAYYNLACLYIEKEDKERAKSILEIALKKFESTIGKSSSLYQTSGNLLTQLLFAMSEKNSVPVRVAPAAAPMSNIAMRVSFSFDRLNPKWKAVFNKAGVTAQDLGNPQVSRLVLQKIMEIVKPGHIEVNPPAAGYTSAAPNPEPEVPSPQPPPPTPSTPGRTFVNRAVGTFKRGVHKITKTIGKAFSPRSSRNGVERDASNRSISRSISRDQPVSRSDRSLTAPPSLMTMRTIPGATTSSQYFANALGILEEEEGIDKVAEAPPIDLLSALPDIDDLSPEDASKIHEMLAAHVPKLRSSRRASDTWDVSNSNIASSSRNPNGSASSINRDSTTAPSSSRSSPIISNSYNVNNISLDSIYHIIV